MPRRWSVLAAILALACGGPAQRRYEDELEATPAPAVHVVHGERLVELMRGLERLRRERLPKEMNVEAELEVRSERVAEVALALAASARRIPDSADVSGLDVDERRRFRELTEELGARSERLAEQARRRPVGNLEEAVASVEETCNLCHVRFRVGGLHRAR
jgi:hypothetical protein